MRRIKDRIISFMTKHIPRTVLLLFLILFCLPIPLKSAYACISGVSESRYYVSCTTEAEAIDFLSSSEHCTACETSISFITTMQSDHSGYVVCYAPPLIVGGPGCSFSATFDNNGCPGFCCNNPGGYYIRDGFLICCAGTVNPCCGKKVGDPCCQNPDDPLCKKCGGTGSGTAATSAVSGK